MSAEQAGEELTHPGRVGHDVMLRVGQVLPEESEQLDEALDRD
jgi:hypothetical protein